MLFGEAQHMQRLSIVGLRAHAPVQPPHRLHVVIEDVRPGIEHARHGIQIAAKIRREYFDPGFRQRPPDFAYGLGEVMRAAIRQIVAIDARDHHIAQLHLRRHSRDVAAARPGRAKTRCLAAEPLGTEQNPQPRVQRLPRIMKVAAPR